MSMRETFEILEHVGEIAMLAGLRGAIEEDSMQFVLGIGLAEGRKQLVFVRRAGGGGKRRCVTILSPCLRVKKRLLGGVSKEMAIDLLRRNERLFFARYGLWEANKESMVVASVDYLLDSLDADAFGHAVMNVAVAADTYEREHGLDEF